MRQQKDNAVVRFGKSALAREVFEDVKDGIRMNISVGYQNR
jgi:sRNA-binding protein